MWAVLDDVNLEETPLTDRDYCAEMRAVIDQATADGPYVAGIVAAEIVDKLRANDPELLAGWLDAQAADFVRQAIGARDRSTRASIRHHAPRSAFADAAERFQQGDTEALSGYMAMPFTLADGARKPLAHLTHDDLTFVSADYQQRADRNAFYATLMATIAKKVKTGTVADHYTEAQLAAMFAPAAA